MTAYEAYMQKLSSEITEKNQVADDIVQNIGYGFMTNTRGGGPVSPLGGSMGGIVDGIFARPLINGSIHLIESGIKHLGTPKIEA